MRYEKSDEPILAMKDRLMIYRTCAAGYRRRLYGRENLTQRRGSDLDKEEVDSMITTIGCDKKLHRELQQCHSFHSE